MCSQPILCFQMHDLALTWVAVQVTHCSLHVWLLSSCSPPGIIYRLQHCDGHFVSQMILQHRENIWLYSFSRFKAPCYTSSLNCVALCPWRVPFPQTYMCLRGSFSSSTIPSGCSCVTERGKWLILNWCQLRLARGDTSDWPFPASAGEREEQRWGHVTDSNASLLKLAEKVACCQHWPFDSILLKCIGRGKRHLRTSLWASAVCGLGVWLGMRN